MNPSQNSGSGDGLADADGDILGDSLAEGDIEGDSLALGEILGDSLDDGETLGLSLADGLTLAEGLTDGDSLALGETLADSPVSVKDKPIKPQSSERAVLKLTVLFPPVPESNQRSEPHVWLPTSAS